MAAKSGIIQTDLTKGQIRKLNALRKSVGPDIGERAFAQWLKGVNAGKSAAVAALGRKGLSIPRGGYLITRGRGRVLVERADT